MAPCAVASFLSWYKDSGDIKRLGRGCKPIRIKLRHHSRANGLKIGVVIDESHIGVSSETEFGKFCKQIASDKLILATATPKDQKLNQFLGYGEFTSFESFIVSRDEAVEAHLNKRYVIAYVYRIGELWKNLADIRKSVLPAFQRRYGKS